MIMYFPSHMSIVIMCCAFIRASGEVNPKYSSAEYPAAADLFSPTDLNFEKFNKSTLYLLL